MPATHKMRVLRAWQGTFADSVRDVLLPGVVSRTRREEDAAPGESRGWVGKRMLGTIP